MLIFTSLLAVGALVGLGHSILLADAQTTRDDSVSQTTTHLCHLKGSDVPETTPRCTGKEIANDTCVDFPLSQVIGSREATRGYVMSFPESYNRSDTKKTYPLILSFHGRTKNAYEQQLLTNFSINSINPEAIVVYPQGVSCQWQGDPRASSDDIAFVGDLLQFLNKTRRYPINESQIFATGKSNGGGFVNLLACDKYLSSIISAFVAVSGAFYVNGTGDSPPLILPTCSPSNASKPIRFMEFHGTSDCTIQYAGGPDKAEVYDTRPVFSVVMDWASQANCKLNAVMSVGSCGITQYSWDCGDVNNAVVHFKIPNLLHDWPNTDWNDDCKSPGVNLTSPTCPAGGYCNTCINASRIIMDWLFNSTLPVQPTVQDLLRKQKFEL